MRRLLRLVPLVWRTVRRSPIRSGLTIAGIAVAMYMFTAVEAMRSGVRSATEATAEDATLVVYRENRYCPFTSRLPQWYQDRIERIDGVRSADADSGEQLPCVARCRHLSRCAGIVAAGVFGAGGIHFGWLT